MAKEKPAAKKLSPEQALACITGCSAADAKLRCEANKEAFAKLPELHANKDREGIAKVLSSEKARPAKKPEQTPTGDK